MSLEETDAVFMRAYCAAIKSKFQIPMGKHDAIYVCPVVQRGVAAGDLIYPQMTSYLIYQLADHLQYADNPAYTGGSAGSYIQQLRSYIEWVKTKSNPSQVAADRMAKARNALDFASDNYNTTLSESLQQFKQVKELFPGKTFWQWAAVNSPKLGAAERTRSSAMNEFNQASQQYFGPDAAVLSGYMTNITNAQNGLTSFPGLNMAGLIDDQSLIAAAIKQANSGEKTPEADLSQSIVQVPAYTIQGYKDTVQAWITDAGRGATRDNVVEIDISKGQNSKWEDYGFKKVEAKAGGGFWPFFHVEVNAGSTTEKKTLNTKNRESGISMSLAMIGIQKFDIAPGQWDIAGIKTLFPERLPAAPDVLSNKMAKPVSVLVGYDVQLRVTFSAAMREDVNEMYNKVKTNGGSLSIFGFRVSAGGGGGSEEQVQSKFEDVKWDKATGSMTLTPTKGQVYPTILAVIGQKLD